MAMLDNLKIRLGISPTDTSKDAELNLVVTDAEGLFKDFCNRTDIPTEASGLVERLALLIYERQVSGYKQGASMGDRSITYFVLNDDLPKSFRQQLSRYRKLVMI